MTTTPIPTKGNKLNRFKTNGYAKSYTPKAGTTKAANHLRQLKDAIKQEKKER